MKPMIKLCFFLSLVIIANYAEANDVDCGQLLSEVSEYRKQLPEGNYTQNFKQAMTLTKQFSACQKIDADSLHSLYYSALSAGRKLNLDENEYQKILDEITLNLEFVNDKKLLRSYEVKLQEVDFLILKRKLDTAISISEASVAQYQKSEEVIPYLYKAYAQQTRAFLYKSEFSKAIELSFIAIEEIKKHAPEQYGHLGFYYSNLGAANYLLKDYANAKKYMLEAEKTWLKIREPDHISFANLYNNLGALTNSQPGDNAQEAIDFYLKALPIYQKKFTNSHHRVLTVYSNIAGTYQQMGEEKKAGQYFERYALNYDFKKSTFTDLGRHGLYVAYLINEGKFEQAIAWYEKVEQVINREGYDYRPLFDGIDAFIRSYTASNQLSIAFDWARFRLEKTIEYVESIVIEDDVALIPFFQETVQKGYLLAITELYAKAKKQDTPTVKSDSYETLLTSLNLFNHNSAGKHQALQYNFTSNDTSKEKALLLKKKSRLLKSIVNAGLDKNKVVILRNELNSVNQELSFLNRKEEKAISGVITFALKDVQKHMHSDQSLVYYVQANQKVMAIVIDIDSIDIVALPNINPERFREEIISFQTSVKQQNVDYVFQLKPFEVKASHSLYKQLIAELPLKSSVTFAQTSLVEQIPFAALVKALPVNPTKATTYLIADHDINYIPSLSSLLSKGENKHSLASIAFGEPLLNPQEAKTRSVDRIILSENARDNAVTISSLSSLPETASELDAFNKYIDNSRVYRQTDLTEQTVKQLLATKNRIVSFATHALSVEYPSGKVMSALVLTPREKPEVIDEGLLTTEDIEALNVEADLVVLSACNSAASEDGSLNDLSGLTSSFLFAGAQNVLVSTASVSDDATSKVMGSFYQSAHLGYKKALAEGMKSLMNSKHYSHPYYWANFKLVGSENYEK